MIEEEPNAVVDGIENVTAVAALIPQSWATWTASAARVAFIGSRQSAQAATPVTPVACTIEQSQATLPLHDSVSVIQAQLAVMQAPSFCRGCNLSPIESNSGS